MEITTLCTVLGLLRVLPDSSQFFRHDSASLSCRQEGNVSEWSIKRNTSIHKNQKNFCVDPMATSHCYIDALYPSDSGVYWCESAAGECCDAVRITVTDHSVILEGPYHPVTEGDNVTLTCRMKEPSSNRTDFYKDGLLIRSSSTGVMTILSVSKSDEGLYICNISGSGKSSPRYLAVTGLLAPPNSRLAHVPLPVVAVCLLLILLFLLATVMLLCLRRRLKGKGDPVVLYTDVTTIQEVPSKRVADMEAVQTTYSTVKPGNV
ncbi:low affinity immunoglobulin gamma Fc region receptor III-A-like isoform X2 [Antennarius striatus]|uniref:low affinity immunoglobulin gamma Fc region receptor III-A-like isoform X2 n=1 Tax=Antennarius striatus TaxID=241820 RepID=UPI0035B49CB3